MKLWNNHKSATGKCEKRKCGTILQACKKWKILLQKAKNNLLFYQSELVKTVKYNKI